MIIIWSGTCPTIFYGVDKIMFRPETRRNRYDKKKASAQTLPVSVCTVNFGIDVNLALTIRAAVCYGAENVFVIGSIPDHKYLSPASGSTVDYINLVNFKTPHEFLNFSRENSYKIVSAELCDGAVDLDDYNFSFDKKTVIVLGNENTGVPSEIIFNSDPVFIRMNGAGYCLNTMQTGSVFLNEYSRQYKKFNKQALSTVVCKSA